MKEIITYEAFDGTKFDNEWDCQKYEFNKLFEKVLKENSLKIYDLDFNEIKIDINVDFELIWYVELKTQNAVNIFIEWLDNCGQETAGIDQNVGKYLWQDYGKWITWEEYTESTREISTKLNWEI